jgi:hypothetical protein
LTKAGRYTTAFFESKQARMNELRTISKTMYGIDCPGATFIQSRMTALTVRGRLSQILKCFQDDSGRDNLGEDPGEEVLPGGKKP